VGTLVGQGPLSMLLGIVVGARLASSTRKQFAGKEEASKKQIIRIALACSAVAVVLAIAPALIAVYVQ
jgi:hypothetical protein